jgi:hypothetical protein
MTVPAANEGGVVVILAIGSQANARAGPEDRNLVEKVVMVLHRSEISDAAPTGRQAFHPGSHEIKSLSIFGWQIAPQCGMIPQSPGTWLSLMLWVQTFLISSDDRRVSGFLLFHLRLRYHSMDPQHYQLQSSKNGRRKMPTCTVILPCLSCLGLLITHFWQEFLGPNLEFNTRSLSDKCSVKETASQPTKSRSRRMNNRKLAHNGFTPPLLQSQRMC